MFTKSVDFYASLTGTGAYSSAVPTTNGGYKNHSAGTIAATGNAADDYQLKRIELDATSGNGAWTSSVPTGISGAGISEIILQLTVQVVTGAGSTLSSGQKFNLYYAFSTEDLLTTDNEANRTAARKTLLPSAKLLPLTLPGVSAEGTEKRILNTDKITVRGEFLYVWVEHGNIEFSSTSTGGKLNFQVNAVG